MTKEILWFLGVYAAALNVGCANTPRSSVDSGTVDKRLATKESNASAGQTKVNTSSAPVEVAPASPVFTLNKSPLNLRCKPSSDLGFAVADGLSPNNLYLLSRFTIVGGAQLPFNSSSLPSWLKSAGFQDIKLLENSQKGVQGFVASADQMNLVVFRGTHSVQGVVTDIAVGDPSGHGGVHKGFSDAYQSVSSNLMSALNGEKWNRPTFFVGHSLGGALALVAAMDVRSKSGNVAGVVTLGQPRTGNANFASAAEKALPGKVKRYVFDLDLIPHLPPSPGSSEAAASAMSSLLSKAGSGLGSLFGIQLGSTSDAIVATVGAVFAQRNFSHVVAPDLLGSSSLSRMVYSNDKAWDEQFWSSNKDKVKAALENPATAMQSSILADHAVENYLCELVKRVK